MASTYSPNLRIELIAVGEQANTWGGTTNNNLGTLIEQAISGVVTVDVTLSNVTLSTLNGATDQSRQMVIIATGTPGVARVITAPAVGKVYEVHNNSDASLSFIASGGTGVTLIVGAKKYIYCDGTNFYESINALTVTSGTINNTTIGATTATTGKFTTVQSTVTTGTAPFIVASTTAVANLTASNVSTNANLTGAVTSVGNASSLGSFTSLQLLTALTDETGTGSTGTGSSVFATSPTLVTPALGTPSALVGTNITGTATAFTASNVTTNANLTGGVTSVGNATTVVTNANLTGDVTSVGNATTLATVNSNVGAFTNASVTVNAKGLITAVSTGASFVPAGTRMPFAQAAAPTGWTQDITDNANNRMLRVVSSAGGGIGGSASPILNNVVSSHTHTFTGSALAAHTHTDSGHQHSKGAQGTPLNGYQGNAANGKIEILNTGVGYANIQGASAGTPSGSISANGSASDWSPRYIDMIICAKD
jgi:hypothetical protein